MVETHQSGMICSVVLKSRGLLIPVTIFRDTSFRDILGLGIHTIESIIWSFVVPIMIIVKARKKRVFYHRDTKKSNLVVFSWRYLAPLYFYADDHQKLTYLLTVCKLGTPGYSCTCKLTSSWLLCRSAQESSLERQAYVHFKGAQVWDIRSLGFSWFLHH